MRLEKKYLVIGITLYNFGLDTMLAALVKAS